MQCAAVANIGLQYCIKTVLYLNTMQSCNIAILVNIYIHVYKSIYWLLCVLTCTHLCNLSDLTVPAQQTLFAQTQSLCGKT